MSKKTPHATLSCSACGVLNCYRRSAKFPDFCLTEKAGSVHRKKALQQYRGRGLDARTARAAAEVEGTYYGKLTRVEEIIAFANRIGAKRIGLIEDLIAALASALG